MKYSVVRNLTKSNEELFEEFTKFDEWRMIILRLKYRTKN